MALLLSASKRGARSIETLDEDLVLRVFLETGRERVEDLRLPRELRESLVEEIASLAGNNVVDFGAGRRFELAIELGPPPRIFRIELVPA